MSGMDGNKTIPKAVGSGDAPLLHALGLCARARALIFGTPMICEAMRTAKKPRLVLVASDASENTRKRLNDKCAFYGVTQIALPLTSADLAHAVGKVSGLAAVGLTDENLCRLVRGALKKCGVPCCDGQARATED